MASIVILVCFYLLSPLLIIYLSTKFSIINKIGVVVVAYISGLLAGNLGIIPETGKQIQEIINMITIPLAIPLLLFSSNLRQWVSLAGKTAISMILGILAVVIMVIAGFLILNRPDTPELWKIGGLLVGVYTGGTPNLASLKLMLNVDEDIYLLTHTYDMLLSGIYFLFLISAGQRFFLLFLQPFRSASGRKDIKMEKSGSSGEFFTLIQRRQILPLLAMFGISAAVFLIAGGVSLLVPSGSQMIVVILIITTLGLAGSLVPKINQTELTFELGMYFILVFSVSVASMVNVASLVQTSTVVLPYLALVIFGSLFLHALFALIFKVDADTVIITSTALICSPPFVPAIAGALKNREIVVSGLTVGIVGYAVGNYLGFLISQLLRLWA